MTADHKILSDGCESRNSHRYAVVVKIWQLNGSNHIRAKQKLYRKQKLAKVRGADAETQSHLR